MEYDLGVMLNIIDNKLDRILEHIGNKSKPPKKPEEVKITPPPPPEEVDL